MQLKGTLDTLNVLNLLDPNVELIIAKVHHPQLHITHFPTRTTHCAPMSRKPNPPLVMCTYPKSPKESLLPPYLPQRNF
jgi:hypothetical protein